MPEICSFNGMSIKIIREDHLPKHLHVFVGRSETRITFDGEILSGKLEPDKLKSLRKWLNKRQTELNDCWEKAMRKEPIERIEP
jgi:nitric oxide reductase activation protein